MQLMKSSYLELTARGHVTDLLKPDDTLEMLETYGFAVTQSPVEAVSTAHAYREIAAIREDFGLGEPYVPLLYRDRDEPTVTAVTRKGGSDHPVFHTGEAQGWHTDGLLEDIGTIKTTLLYCVSPAHRGGRTFLLNAGRVFEELRMEDPEAADVLLRDTILGRRSTIPGVDREAVGPVFLELGDGHYATRYGEGRVERWYPADAAEQHALDRALRFFRARRDDPDVRIDLLLRAGQCLIFRNDVLAHGRENFTDDPQRPRLLLRSLHTNAPKKPS
uniref:Uridine-5'-phosphate dioxygenase n=1 Tax=Streptomyces sp. TaxID=1931 RepID=UMPDO_STRSQ|nr:RecName: Full=Uridine-5'-phosphate dioxygenase; AltName: Full=Fe(II)-dependent alpha-ketoglutarate:uridine-5'-monophosphate dioxygenase; Short=Fe(II)-dependent alpha-KG:UMP dioxygenase; AltName: Full=UMP:alpha-ketoglutarate dioxygenase [Streptomyces sp.]BAJ05888.1 putative dioxygenase [Streptomyces sp. SANK 60405]